MIRFEKKSNIAVSIWHDNRECGKLSAVLMQPGFDSVLSPIRCEDASVANEDGKTKIIWHHTIEYVSITLALSPCECGFSGALSAKGSGYGIVRLLWELPSGERGFPFVPAFMYGHNEGGNSPRAKYPQLDNGQNGGWQKPWVASEWQFRTDRSSHGVTSVITEQFVYALGGRDVCLNTDSSIAEKTGLGITSSDPHQLSFSLGFANRPYTYSYFIGHNYISRPEGYADLSQEINSPVFLLIFPHENRHVGAANLLRNCYKLLHDEVNADCALSLAITDISEALLEYAYSPGDRQFYVTVPGELRTPANPHNMSSGWTGGTQAAFPLLRAGRQLNQPRWIECAQQVLTNIAENAISPNSGLFYENYDAAEKRWSTRGWWYGALENPGHTGYVNGHICHYLLKGHLLEREFGVEHPSWLSAANKVLDHVADVQGKDGRFGYTYSEEDGTMLDGDGFSGCWFTPAFANLYRITKTPRYLDVARVAMDFYRRYVEDFHVFGGPHDIFKSPDQEGILSWIAAACLLHEVTGEERYLTDLCMGLDYEFSWRFAYNVEHELEPLKPLRWSTTGGSVTSVNNAHIHPMGSAVNEYLLYAVEQTGDPYLKSRLLDSVRWSLTVHLQRDGHHGWGKKGMTSELFCHSDSLLAERHPDGSPSNTWFCYLPWAAGSLLEGLTGRIYEIFRQDIEL